MGIALGAGRSDLAWGALILFLTNAAAIIVAGVVVFSAAGSGAAAAERGPHVRRRARMVIAVLVVALLIPLGLTSVRTYRYQRWMNVTETVARASLPAPGWRVTDVHQAGDEIVVVVVGSGDPASIADLRARVSRSVPASVKITLVENNGTTIEL